MRTGIRKTLVGTVLAAAVAASAGALALTGAVPVQAAQSEKMQELARSINYSQQYTQLPEIAAGSWNDMKIQVDDMIFREDGTETLLEALNTIMSSANAAQYSFDFNPAELIDNTTDELHDYVVTKNGNDYFTLRCIRANYSPASLQRQAINASELYVFCVRPEAEAKHNTFYSGGIRYDLAGITYDNFWTFLSGWKGQVSYSYAAGSGLTGILTFTSNHPSPASYIRGADGNVTADPTRAKRMEQIQISFDPTTREAFAEARTVSFSN